MRKPMRSPANWRQIVATAMLSAGMLWATNKGPDAGSYTVTDGNGTVYSFIDPAGSGSAPFVLNGAEVGGNILTLPFPFLFYGQSYTMVCVSVNGLAYLVTDQTFCGSTNQRSDFANTDISSTAVPGDLPAIAPFWSNLTFAAQGAGAVYYQTVGTSPNRQFVIEWYNAVPSGTLSPVTFEAILNETTNNIQFQYQTVNLGNGNASLGGQATVGIRNSQGNTNGKTLQWSFDSPVLSNSYSILYTAPSVTATSVNTIDTSPTGLNVNIDGVDTPTPATVRWVPASQHILLVASQTTTNSKTTFTSWSPSGATPQITVTAQATGISYVANFSTQYLLTTSANPSNQGSVNGNGTFVNANTPITVTATPLSGYVFKFFSGDLSGSTNPQQLNMNGVKNVVATFGLPYVCSVSNGSSATVADVQAFVSEALGLTSPLYDAHSDGVVNIVDIQIVINAVLGKNCTPQ